jgi:hypothetical protein
MYFFLCVLQVWHFCYMSRACEKEVFLFIISFSLAGVSEFMSMTV